MRDLLAAIGFAITVSVIGAALFAAYAATAVIYGAPLLFVLWLFGAL